MALKLYGCPAGDERNAPRNHPRLTLPSGLTLTSISGGAIDISGADTGDSILDIFVSTHPTEDLLGGDTVAWATSDTVFARLIARKINEKAAEHHYWATAVTDHVFIWPQDGSAADTGTITCDDVGFTATIADMNAEQAFVAAVRWNSGNEGVDAFADTKMYRIGFDMDHLRSINDEIDMSGALGAEVDFTTEDQILTLYFSGGGTIPLGASAVTKTIATLGVAQRHVDLFAQSAAAQNPTYVNRVY